jgi:hypothetical protein
MSPRHGWAGASWPAQRRQSHKPPHGNFSPAGSPDGLTGGVNARRHPDRYAIGATQAVHWNV